MALVLSVQKWRHYLHGRHFIVKTDHSSLKYLWDQKLTTSAQHRWLVKLMGFDFHIECKKGIDNTVADVLSRRGNANVETSNCDDSSQYAATSLLIPQCLHTIEEEVNTEEKLQEIIQQITSNMLSPKHWKYETGVIFYKGRIYFHSESVLS